MPIHQLTQVGRTSGGVVLPKGELRALGLVDENGNIKEQPLRVTQINEKTWEVSVIRPNDYPKTEVL